MAKRKPKTDWGPMGAFALPRRLMYRPEFENLSPKATKVLLVLGKAYNGRNNGNLAATESIMVTNGRMDKKTLASALRELLDCGLIIKTREPRKGSKETGMARCALYGLAWVVIDECPGADLDVTPGPAPFKFT